MSTTGELRVRKRPLLPTSRAFSSPTGHCLATPSSFIEECPGGLSAWRPGEMTANRSLLAPAPLSLACQASAIVGDCCTLWKSPYSWHMKTPSTFNLDRRMTISSLGFRHIWTQWKISNNIIYSIQPIQMLEAPTCLHAVGQGALAVECRF